MTIAGFGQRGWNPAARQSFLVTEALEGMISLEDLALRWRKQPPPAALRRKVIEKVAHVARTLHENGVNHRDFYICHFLVDPAGFDAARSGDDVRIHLIDLHRAHVRKRTPWRWVIKDVSGLFFSCMDAGLGRADLFRFMRIYRGRSLRASLHEDARFWRRVGKSAVALYRKVHGRPPDPAVAALADAEAESPPLLPARLLARECRTSRAA
jgi:heptose I phosphotransferase